MSLFFMCLFYGHPLINSKSNFRSQQLNHQHNNYERGAAIIFNTPTHSVIVWKTKLQSIWKEFQDEWTSTAQMVLLAAPHRLTLWCLLHTSANFCPLRCDLFVEYCLAYVAWRHLYQRFFRNQSAHDLIYLFASHIHRETIDDELSVGLASLCIFLYFIFNHIISIPSTNHIKKQFSIYILFFIITHGICFCDLSGA